MSMKIGTVSVFVSDQQRAKAFYSEKLGMEIRSDAEMEPGSSARWIEVAPPGSYTTIVLFEPDGMWDHFKQAVGKPQNITLNVDDIDATYNDLKGKGVSFAHEPKQEFWGKFTMLEDSEGNHLLLVQTTDSG